MNLANPAPILLRLLGLFFIVEGIAGIASAVVYSIMEALDEVTYAGVSTLAFPVSRCAWSAVALMLGLYFFSNPPAVAARITSGD